MNYSNGLFCASSSQDASKKKAEIQSIIKKSYHGLKCLCPGCQNVAINSHLLQQHGILDHASRSHKFIEVRYKDIFNWGKDDISCEFKEVGINQTLSYPLFCAEHDTLLFKDFEQRDTTLDSYRTQLLLSYRTLVCEYRKVEIVLTQHRDLLSRNFYNGDLECLGEYIKLLMSHGNFIQSVLNFIINDLNGVGMSSFSFIHYKYPKVEVAASAVLGFDDDKIIDVSNLFSSHNLIVAFIHVIPQKESTEIIIGYPKFAVSNILLDYIKRWHRVDNIGLGYMLTDLIANKAENVCLSKELFDAIPKCKLDLILKHINVNRGLELNPKEINFNIFDSIYY